MTIAQSQEKHKHLLTALPGETATQMWARSWMFTNNVCFDNRDQFAMIQKVGGRVCGPGVDCDKVIHRSAPHAIYDLVRAAGSASAAPICDHATNHDGTLAYGHPADFAEPMAYDGTTPVPVPVPGPGAQPYPDEPAWWGAVFTVAVVEAYAQAGRVFPDSNATPEGVRATLDGFRWWARCGYKIRNGMTKETALADTLRELRMELGVP